MSTTRVAREAEDAVLERVAAALEAALPELTIELIHSEQGARMHRLSHEGLASPVYIYVQASAFGAVTAAKVLQGKGVLPEAHVGPHGGRVLTETEVAAAKALDKDPCKAGNTKGVVCGGTLDQNGTCDREATHA